MCVSIATAFFRETRVAVQSAALAQKAGQRDGNCRNRNRLTPPGMLLLQDGSTHQWPADFLLCWRI
jgi:hypothetical protein